MYIKNSNKTIRKKINKQYIKTGGWGDERKEGKRVANGMKIIYSD